MLPKSGDEEDSNEEMQGELDNVARIAREEAIPEGKPIAPNNPPLYKLIETTTY